MTEKRYVINIKVKRMKRKKSIEKIITSGIRKK